ncbi:MAG: hypothetical protein VXA34_00415 [Gammaproteobacteria bacterium]|jgi:hypothetical protein
MSSQFKSTEYVLRVLRDADIEVSHMNEDEGCIWLAIPVDNPEEEIVLDDFERGFITAFCIEINDKIRTEYANDQHSYLPEDDWSEKYCHVPENEGSDGKMFDINYGFIEDRGSYRFWATAYPIIDCDGVTKTDGSRYVRIV